MNQNAQQLMKVGEYFAAGFLEEPDSSVTRRICRAYRRYYENCPMSYKEGSLLFPSGPIQFGELAVEPQYCMQYLVNMQELEEKCKKVNCEKGLSAFRAFHECCGWGYAWDGGWSHSSLHYKRILAEGVRRYEERVHAMVNEDLREALLEVLAGIRIYHSRALEYLKTINAPRRLIEALERVPYAPAQTAYEAVVCVNFMLYLDQCDNIGRVDSWLYPYWNGEDVVSELHQMFKNLQDNRGWSIALGPDYNEITKQCLLASEGLARPMVELRVTEDMPDDLWELAVLKVLSGGGQPSFYNDTAIQERLQARMPHASKEDIQEFGGVGCTETCLGGMTYSGGVDINLNILKILEKHMEEELCNSSTFDIFYESFMSRVHMEQEKIKKRLILIYENRAKWSFAPIRTLFIDDCIDKEIGYLQGGARYSFAVPADSGIPNTIDSLLAIRELIYDRKIYTAEEFLDLLIKQEPQFKKRLEMCSCYGIADEKADALMGNFTTRFYAYYRENGIDGLDIFPTSHQFERHVEEGQMVGPTPDGRSAGQSLADSIAAVNGKAVKGPTPMLCSAAKFVQDEIYGIPVLNLSITRKYDPDVLRALIQGYFALGGTQMQITCTTRETLLEARRDPDSYRDLIVRVGGFSEYFCNLNDGLKDAVIDRTMFEG